MASRLSALPVVTKEEWWGKCKKADILGKKVSYYDSEPAGNNEHTVVFIHGNPTSSYIWRNVIPRVEPLARCLAPDLMGFGQSSKLVGGGDAPYRFVEQYRYISAWFDSVKKQGKISLVLEDWGAVFGLHWANENRERVEGLVFFEAIIAPLPGYETFPAPVDEIARRLRSDAGEDMILKRNEMLEDPILAGPLMQLRKEERGAFLAPFKNPGEDRRPMLTFPRQIPIAGDGPDDVIAIAAAYSTWLKSSSHLPKLYIHATPGFYSSWNKDVVADWKNLKTVEIEGPAFLLELDPIKMRDIIQKFIQNLFK